MTRVLVLVGLLIGGVVQAQAPPSLAQAVDQARREVQEQSAIVANLPEYRRLQRLQDHLKLLEALAAKPETGSK